MKRLQERYLAISCGKSDKNGQEKRNQFQGPVAQRITRLTTNREIAGSKPARLDSIFQEDQISCRLSPINVCIFGISELGSFLN